MSGVLVDDTISDHLPVFSCLSLKGLVKNNVIGHKIVRDIPHKNVTNFKKDLENVDWNMLYTTKNCNEAFQSL